MASTLVDINQGCRCKVRMLNPFPTAIFIKQNSVLGTAEPIIGTQNAVAQHDDDLERVGSDDSSFNKSSNHHWLMMI